MKHHDTNQSLDRIMLALGYITLVAIVTSIAIVLAQSIAA